MKKEKVVGTRIPEELVRDLEAIEKAEQSDRSTTLRKLLSKAIGDWKMEHYAHLYGEGKISLARAAEQAGVSLWEMMAYARSGKIPAQYELEDFRDDLSKDLFGKEAVADLSAQAGNRSGQGAVRLQTGGTLTVASLRVKVAKIVAFCKLCQLSQS